MKRTPVLALLAFLWFGAVTLACNLGGPSAPPPTLVPRMTETPQPTLAYATLSPAQLPQQPSSGPAADARLLSLLNLVESDRLFLHVDALQRFGTRHVNSAFDRVDQGVGAAYRYVRGQFENIQKQSGGRLTVFDHSFPVTWVGVNTTHFNVVGVLQGTEIGGGVILVGAHYDSISIDPKDPNYPAPGANDNASGIAALIEIARILSTRPHRSTIMFVAFGAEEIGRVGSIEFVKYLQNQKIAIDAMINMDIIGSQTGPLGEVDDRSIRLYSQGPNESASRQLARALQLANRLLNPNSVILIKDSVDRDGRYGDHMSFSEAGFAAVRFVENLEDRSRQHTPMDTLDDIQATYLMRSTQTVLLGVTMLADGPRAPRNLSLRDNGLGTRTLVWEPNAEASSYLVALRRPNSLVYDETFPWTSNTVDWNGFTSSQFAGLAIFSVDSGGLMGPPTLEYPIP